jgi:hypothetical protein
MPEIDDLSGILFKDDSQVKILMASYEQASKSGRKPGVYLKCLSLGYFIQDLELADRIVSNDFSNSDTFLTGFLSEPNYYNDLDNYLDNLSDLEKDRELYLKDGDSRLYESLRLLSLWRIQEHYLENNSLDESKVLLLLRSLTKAKKYSFPHNKEIEDKIKRFGKSCRIDFY